MPASPEPPFDSGSREWVFTHFLRRRWRLKMKTAATDARKTRGIMVPIATCTRLTVGYVDIAVSADCNGRAESEDSDE